MDRPVSPPHVRRLLPPRRLLALAVAVGVACSVLVGTALAHSGSLGGSRQDLSVPQWLVLMTGGGAVGASFLLASFVTDRAFLRAIHDTERGLGSPVRPLVVLGRVGGVVGLVGVLVTGLFAEQLGLTTPLRNLAVLVVWVGWWAGFSMTTYLLGNSWPVLNPWRTVADLLPSLDRSLPERVGGWPSVALLLALVWLEVVSPVAADPTVLATVILVYTVFTLAGAVVFGPEAWFTSVDPISRVFAAYGRVAPLTVEDGRIRARLPGTALSDASWVAGRDDVAFVVALLWVTTYDGFVATPTWRSLITPLVEAGVPAPILYPLALVVGFLLFYGAYRLAARYGRRYADSLLTTDEVARRFAPSLLAIAAGYHVAHYLGYFLSLSPSLFGVLSNPLSPPPPLELVLPPWFGGVGLTFVLLGHVLAIWVAHTAAFELFPSRVQAIRSQYALTAVMVLYTMTSLLIVSQPAIEVPYL